jgi:hypothetical protein
MLNTSSCPLIDARQGALHALTQAAAQAGSRISISINRSPAYETGANASRLMPAPGRDDLVTPVFVDFAAGFGDGERKIDDKAVE